MFFAGSDIELLEKALSPPLATWHYAVFVVMTPLIMLNLLIALMGGSYERIEQNTKNAMRRQKAELLVSLEVLMSEEDKGKPEYFPRWLYWYRPAEREEEDTSDENGVINGVRRMLAQQSDAITEEIGGVLAQVEELNTKMEQEPKEKSITEQLLSQQSKEIGDVQAQVEELNTKMEQELKGISAKFDQLLAICTSGE